MADLIERSTLIEKVRNVGGDIQFENHEQIAGAKKALSDVVPKIMDALKNAPTVDAVEVIRCRDCKYYHQRRETFGDCRQGDDWREVYPDDFCSYGERKENGE